MWKIARLLSVVILALAGVAVAVPAAATEGYCGISWGSKEKTAAPLGQAPVVDLRTGRHSCFDRIVFEIAGPAAGYRVGYVDQVIQEGSGAVLPVPGGARLRIDLHHPAYDNEGNDTLPRRNVDLTGYRTFRSVVHGGSFEGYTLIGVGTRAHLPFRVFTLAGPGGHSRIVVDVAHRWS